MDNKCLKKIFFIKSDLCIYLCFTFKSSAKEIKATTETRVMLHRVRLQNITTAHLVTEFQNSVDSYSQIFIFK
jgi:hypothetical protein